MKNTSTAPKQRIKKSANFSDKTIHINLLETKLFLKSFMKIIDFDCKKIDMASRQKSLLKYAWMELSVELIEIAEQESVDFKKCSILDAEKYIWEQVYLILSILARILSNPRTNIWGNGEDSHLRTILFKLKSSFGEDEERFVIDKILDPVFAGMKNSDDAPYKSEIMDALSKIMASISYLDKLRFLGFIQETAIIDQKLSESDTITVSKNRPYILSYKEHGLRHKVAMVN